MGGVLLSGFCYPWPFLMLWQPCGTHVLENRHGFIDSAVSNMDGVLASRLFARCILKFRGAREAHELLHHDVLQAMQHPGGFCGAKLDVRKRFDSVIMGLAGSIGWELMALRYHVNVASSGMPCFSGAFRWP